MVGAIIGGGIAKKLGGLALKAAPTIIAVTIGFSLGLAYEASMPWGWKARYVRAIAETGEVRESRDLYKAEAGAWKLNRDGWKAYADRLASARTAANDDAADNVGRCSADASAASTRAFNNGFTAGRSAGRKSCGASDATSPDPGRPPGGGVRDDQTLSARWRDGAYVPPGAVPAHR